MTFAATEPATRHVTNVKKLAKMFALCARTQMHIKTDQNPNPNPNNLNNFLDTIIVDIVQPRPQAL